MSNITISKRRQNLKDDLGFSGTAEKMQIETALTMDKLRHQYKEYKKESLRYSSSYMSVETIAKWMDKYCLDAVIGLVPTIGDALTSILVLPSIYVSLFKIRSIPLTLAVIYNIVKDAAIGMIPVLGMFLDFANRAFIQNMRLISGFVVDDRAIIDEVNKTAVKSAIMIIAFAVIIWLLIEMVQAFWGWLTGLFS